MKEVAKWFQEWESGDELTDRGIASFLSFWNQSSQAIKGGTGLRKGKETLLPSTNAEQLWSSPFTVLSLPLSSDLSSVIQADVSSH